MIHLLPVVPVCLEIDLPRSVINRPILNGSGDSVYAQSGRTSILPPRWPHEPQKAEDEHKGCDSPSVSHSGFLLGDHHTRLEKVQQ